MSAYVNRQFCENKDGEPKGTVAVFPGEAGKLTIIISAESVSLRNFWSGNWLSTYTVVQDGSKYIVAGEVGLTFGSPRHQGTMRGVVNGVNGCCGGLGSIAGFAMYETRCVRLDA